MIKNASIEDLATLVSISQKSFQAPWSSASFEAELYKSMSRVYIYMSGEQSVAFLIIWVIGNEGEIVSLAVDPAWRGKGIAKKLIQHAFDSNKGAKKWSLEVNPNNTPAINLYKKFKFERQRTIKNYYGQGQDALSMVRVG